MKKLWFKFNDFHSLHYPEIFVESVGHRIKTEEKVSEVKIPYREEVMYETDETRVPYPREISLILKDDKRIADIYEKLNGKGILRTSGDLGFFFKCRIISDIRPERIIKGKSVRRIKITFTVQPPAYLEEGNKWTDITNIRAINNIGNMLSEPLYRLSGEKGAALKVNGEEITFDFQYIGPRKVIIDTEILEAYWEGPYGKEITGDIAKLKLNPGRNTIQSTGINKIEIMTRFRDR